MSKQAALKLILKVNAFGKRLLLKAFGSQTSPASMPDSWKGKFKGELEVLPRVFEYSFALRKTFPRNLMLEVGSTASSNILPIYYAQRGSEVVGIDIRSFRAKTKGFTFVLADARHLPFRKECFDSVLCISTLEHIGLQDDMAGDSKAVNEMIKVLKPRSQIIVTVPIGLHDCLPDTRIYPVDVAKNLFQLKVRNEEYAMENDFCWYSTSAEKAGQANHRTGFRAVGMFELWKEQSM